MQRTFFVGDIHGCALTFKKMVEEIIQLNKEDVLYCVGDYIDRGPRSKEVVDYILALRKNNYQVYTLRGNHEQMLLDARLGGSAHMLWMMNGGEHTLRSFGVSSPDEIEEKYQAFFAETEFYKTGQGFITVHAGLNFDAEDPFNDLESMLWIRGFHIDLDFLNGRLLIHGHTPIPKEQILSQPLDAAINIDGGCVYTFREDLGNLMALDLDQKRFLETGNID
ncbi:MAG: metallophosphoesterase family protein [Marinilabiliaceae bacterium]